MKKSVYLVFAFCLMLAFLSCKTRNLGSMSSEEDSDCTIKPTARFGSLFLADGGDQKWFFKVSDSVWADQIASQLAEPLQKAGCSAFLVTQFQELDADVKRFVDAAATKLPMRQLGEYGFGVVQAVYQGFEKHLKTGLSDPDDKLSLQKSLAVVFGQLKNGTPFVATAPLENMLQAGEELEWDIVISPAERAFVARETRPDGTVVSSKYKVKAYTCGNPRCRLTDIPGVLDDCPECGQGRLFGTRFYDTIGQASVVNLSDWGSLAQATDGPDVGCKVCGVSNAGSSVKADGTIACRTCQSEDKPITDRSEGEAMIRKLAEQGDAWVGILSVPKDGAASLRGGVAPELRDGIFDPGAVLRREGSAGDLSFYVTTEETLSRSMAIQNQDDGASGNLGSSGIRGNRIVRVAGGCCRRRSDWFSGLDSHNP